MSEPAIIHLPSRESAIAISGDLEENLKTLAKQTGDSIGSTWNRTGDFWNC